MESIVDKIPQEVKDIIIKEHGYRFPGKFDKILEYAETHHYLTVDDIERKQVQQQCRITDEICGVTVQEAIKNLQDMREEATLYAECDDVILYWYEPETDGEFATRIYYDCIDPAVDGIGNKETKRKDLLKYKMELCQKLKEVDGQLNKLDKDGKIRIQSIQCMGLECYQSDK